MLVILPWLILSLAKNYGYPFPFVYRPFVPNKRDVLFTAPFIHEFYYYCTPPDVVGPWVPVLAQLERPSAVLGYTSWVAAGFC